MFNSKISLDQFTHTLVETINSANARIQTEYISAAQQQGGFCTAPPPLTIKNAKISFDTNISKHGKGLKGDSLILDFNKANKNFYGKLMLSPLDVVEEEPMQDDEELPDMYSEEDLSDMQQPYTENDTASSTPQPNTVQAQAEAFYAALPTEQPATN